jgi:hypothetical protein
VAVFSRTTHFNLPFLDLIFYIIFVALLLITVYNKVKNFDFQIKRIEFVMLCFFLYALLLPRFKDYSYVLLIVPTLCVIREGLSSSIARLAAMSAICITIVPYQPLLVAMTLFVFYLKHLRTLAVKPRSVNG